MTHNELTAYELESYGIPRGNWHLAPEKIRAFAEEGEAEGIPTLVARHPTLGWFVIESGQGPYIAMSESF